MNILITLGPSYEPIDQVRRITNHSTGSLGSFLAEHLFRAGHQVTCLVGSGSVKRPGLGFSEEFTTNDSLLDLLKENASTGLVDAILHLAALSDYKVSHIEDASGHPIQSGKISSRDGHVTLRLEPATKILPGLRALYPQALIIGWKYETDGTRDAVVQKGKNQLSDCNTDLCILNGPAWGKGYGALTPSGTIHSLEDQGSLLTHLIQFLEEK